MDKIQSLKGMIDLIANRSDPDDFAESIFRTEDALKNIFVNFGYSEIRTPTLEDADLFKRSVGDSSDIVNKELYSFLDKNEKNITLRPENTAGVVRSVIEKKIDVNTHKFWYLGPMWRYERPQKGRYRQFNQAGIEIIGYPEGVAELEIISMICSINNALNIKNSVIKINHLGNKGTKTNYCNALLDYLKPFSSQLDQLDQSRLEKNPLRILDSQNQNTQKILEEAPTIKDFLSDESLKMLQMLKDTFSKDCKIEIDYGLVRGLDYYTGLVFEAISDELGAQDAYLGGGRYDNLSEQLGGKDLPCIGMAIGIERLALLSNLVIESKTLISFIILSSNFEEKAYKIAHDLRTINPEIIIDVQLAEGSLKSKLRKASKNNAKFAIIIGEEEIETNTIIIKPLIEKNSEQTVMDINEISSFFEDIT